MSFNLFSAQYELFAQNRNGDLIIKNLMENNYFIKTAQEILSNPALCNGLSPNDAAIIHSIAEMRYTLRV